jgi:hypothetical protein
LIGIFATLMKHLLLSSCAIAFIATLASCGGNKTVKKGPPFSPGTVAAKFDEPVTDDALNNFRFSVKVVADSAVASGVYQVEAEFGPNYAFNKFTMPKGLEHVPPLIRKDTARYTCIVGFRLPDDTAFYDYYKITSSRSSTKMEYIMSYTFE